MKKIPFWTCLTLSLAFIALLWYQAPAQAQETADPDPADASTPPPSQEPPTQQLPNSTKLEGTVVRVVDPDTIEVNLSNGKREKVRLLQIQVPTGRSCGPEAMDRINELILGKTVQLELDAKKRDQEGRLLAYVYVNGKSVQQALLNEGLAKVSSSSQGKYADQYRAFEDHAKALEKGSTGPRIPAAREKIRRLPKPGIPTKMITTSPARWSNKRRETAAGHCRRPEPSIRPRPCWARESSWPVSGFAGERLDPGFLAPPSQHAT